MIDPKMPITAEHKSIVSAEFVRVHDRIATDSFDGPTKQGLGRYVSDDLHLDRPVTLQDAENRHLSRCSPATLPFVPATEVAFV